MFGELVLLDAMSSIINESHAAEGTYLDVRVQSFRVSLDQQTDDSVILGSVAASHVKWHETFTIGLGYSCGARIEQQLHHIFGRTRAAASQVKRCVAVNVRGRRRHGRRFDECFHFVEAWLSQNESVEWCQAMVVHFVRFVRMLVRSLDDVSIVHTIVV